MGHRQGRRGFGIRSRLLALVAVPMIALLAVIGVDVVRATQVARDSARITELVRAGGQVAGLVSDLQAERQWSVRYLVSGGPGAGGAAEGADQLRAARAQTDVRIAALADRQRDAGDAPGGTLGDLATFTLPGLAAHRQAVTDGELGYRDAMTWYDERYEQLLQVVLDATTDIQQRTTDTGLRDRVTNLVTLAGLKELAFQERALLEPAVAGRALTGSQRVALEANAAAQDSQYTLWVSTAPAGAVQRHGAQLEGDLGVSTNLLGDLQPGVSGFGSGADDVDVEAVDEALQQRLDAITAVERSLHAEAVTAARDLESEVATGQRLLLAAAVVVLLVGVLLALVTTRSLVRPMRRLDEAARRLRERLPVVVEGISHSGDVAEPDALPEGVAHGAPPELARLSDALDEVGAVAVDVATEQARLRASISEMFTNFARRNQRLLDKQLSLIDTLEADEEDPDRLAELFGLDHLSTRMRRNAESLLVLAGTDPTTPAAAPLDVVEVVRVAVGEIEDYDRVEIAVDRPAKISGRAVSSLAHLLAELLENATNFSPPTAPVRVETAEGADGGLRILVTDRGIGMSEDELAAANDRIAHPPLIDAAASRLLGFFVVGRLAQKLGVAVHLEPGEPRGIRAVVELPARLLSADEPLSAPPVAAGALPAASAPGRATPPTPAPHRAPPAGPVTAAGALAGDEVRWRSDGPVVDAPRRPADRGPLPAPTFSVAPEVRPTAAPDATAIGRDRPVTGPDATGTGLARRTRGAAAPGGPTTPLRPSAPLSPDTVAATLASLQGGWRQAETEQRGGGAPGGAATDPAASPATPGSASRSTPAAPSLTSRGGDRGITGLPRRSRAGRDGAPSQAPGSADGPGAERGAGEPRPAAPGDGARQPAERSGSADLPGDATSANPHPVPVDGRDAAVTGARQVGAETAGGPVPRLESGDEPAESDAAPASSGSLWARSRRTPRSTPTSWSTPWPTGEDGR